MRSTHGDYSISGTEVRKDDRPVGTYLSSVNALDESSWLARIASVNLMVVRSGFAANDKSDQPLWLSAPRAQWSKFAKHLESLSSESTQLVLWPRSTDVVSDSPSTLSFIRSSPKWKFLVDPASLITPDMRRDVMEHIDRLSELMLAHEACIGVIHPGETLGQPALAALEKALNAHKLPWWRVDIAAKSH